jgi:hypothetical protein
MRYKLAPDLDESGMSETATDIINLCELYRCLDQQFRTVNGLLQNAKEQAEEFKRMSDFIIDTSSNPRFQSTKETAKSEVSKVVAEFLESPGSYKIIRELRRND